MSFVTGMLLLVRIICHLVYCYLEAFVRVFKPPTPKSISGEIVLVTGAGHGIGRQFALQLSQLGATLVLWDVNKENNENTADEIKKAGGKAFAYVCNITDSSQIAEVAAKVRQDVGEVTILVNNAGVLKGAYLLDLDEAAIRHTFEVNILSHFWMDKEFLPSMMKKNHGHILNVASVAGFDGAPCLSDYCSTKHAVLGLAETLKLELEFQGHNGIFVTTLCPMIVDTGMLKNFECKFAPLLTPEEVAETAIDGMRRNYEIITVPKDVYYSDKINRLLPRKARGLLYRFGLVSVNPQYNKKDN